MSTHVSAVSARAGVSTDQGIDWKRYSSSYDVMVRYNPYYQENIRLALKLVQQLGLSNSASVCDIGAGTGNYICALSETLSEGKFKHVDIDAGMTKVARDKYEQHSINVSIEQKSAAEFVRRQESYDLVLCINALYALPNREAVLNWIRSSISPSGYFLVIDFGRKMDVGKWASALFKSAYRTHGLMGLVQLLSQTPKLARQNSAGSRMQQSGNYWLHTTEEFIATLRGHGFQILSSGTCYRDACDYAMCSA